MEVLQAELTPLIEQEQKLEAEHRQAWAIGGATNQYTGDPIIERTEEQILLARDRLEAIPKELRLLRARIAPLRRRAETAQAAVRAELWEKFHERKRRLVAEGDRLATTFAEWNARLAAIEDEENTAVGTAARFSWMEFADETPMTSSRLASWRRHCREHGMLE